MCVRYSNDIDYDKFSIYQFSILNQILMCQCFNFQTGFGILKFSLALPPHQYIGVGGLHSDFCYAILKANN